MMVYNRLFGPLFVFTLLAGAASFAGSKGETVHGQHHKPGLYEEKEMLPHIEAVQLKSGQKLKVLASTSIVGDAVANVGGGDIELTVLIGTGQDPHSYEPTPSALKSVEQAHVLFINGFGLEEGLLESIESHAGGVIVSISAGIAPMEMDRHHRQDHNGDIHHDEEHNAHGQVDPHVWFDPTNVMVWVENIERALSEADPVHRRGYHERAGVYLKQLEDLDASMRRKFSAIPEENRKLVTDHQLFNYFADEYDFEVIGTILPGVSTSAEASARQFATLVELLREEGITTIFVGSTAGRGLDKLSESIADELDDVRIVEMLTGSLHERGKPGDTYIGYMEYNVNQIMYGLKP
jgi:ABC-type Zn uptake system ZnuABC Zn-binding protein ZnuA